MSVSYISGRKLDFKEPRDPNVPIGITNQIKAFEKSGAFKMTKTDRKKEVAIGRAKRKLEAVNLEDQLYGKARDHAIHRRLDKKIKGNGCTTRNK